jgi:type VI secretion system protein ImpA
VVSRQQEVVVVNLDLDILLAGFGEEEPSGPDLEYDSLFADLAIAATSKGEQQVGDKILAAEEADYGEVVKIGSELLTQTMDLRVAVMLAEAGLNRGGFDDFAQVMEYIKRCLVEFWDTVHPQLDPDDDNDPTERVNALSGLMSEQTVMRQIRRTPLTDSKVVGRFSLRHIMVAKGEIVAPADMESPPDRSAIAAAFKDTAEDRMQDIRQALESALKNVDEISAILDEKTPDHSPDFSPIQKILGTCLAAIADVLGGALPDSVGANDSAQGGNVSSGGGAQGGSVSGISSTNDVLRAIDLINEYYARNEPSSPIPIFLNRARRLVSADFLTIMKDMASSGIDEVRTIGGLPSDDEY